VQEGRFGACLMAEPALVGECVAAMKAAVTIPVTVKCRIGIDEQDPEEALETLTRAVKSAGVDALIVHARKAWLAGLSPKENRDIPPLDYDRVYRLKKTHPELLISINGGVGSVEAARDHLPFVDGVMMGRAAYQEPWRLLAVDPMLFGEDAAFTSPKQALEAFFPYAMSRHILGLFHAVPGARAFRRHIAINAVKPGADIGVLRDAMDLVMDSPAQMTHTAAA
jgi:tRNA-dihydrouridine synthase A